MKSVAVVGAGPAGLMAAEVLSQAGVAVHVFDAMPSVGRKFLLAGKGGLNLTHSEDFEHFVSRYGERREHMTALLRDFDPARIRLWAASLGVQTIVGTSGRVFPLDMKAAPLLRAWLARLRHPPTGVGVQFHMRHHWLDWSESTSAHVGLTALALQTPEGARSVHADAVVLALGGGSWARLGSDGAWVPWLQAQGVAVAPLRPANCGFDVRGGWSDYFAQRFAGHPLKTVVLRVCNGQSVVFERKGEFVATATGVEGSLVYAASRWLRRQIEQSGEATFTLDLLPDLSMDRVLTELRHPRGSRSLANHLKSRLRLDGIKLALLHEILPRESLQDPPRLAQGIKALPLTLAATRPLDEAISSAGGVLFEGLTPDLMLKQLPGVFCAGEMLDWEAPTGGYLLSACLASGYRSGHGVLRHLGLGN